MLKKVLIANRGEIACRIVRTARRLGVATVAVYSDADARALYVEQADEAMHIGDSPATESYLRGDRIIAAAKATGAEAIHPGYGFLAENADFAEAVAKAGLKFIGPSAEAMRALGGKAAAKEIALQAGVPVVPGYQGERQDARTLAGEAARIGYPVLIKAVAGGGGRGMRLVEREADLAELLASAQREAQGAFGDARVLIERQVERPRHIEVQVFGDSHGNVVHLFERDCTLQRRNQKVVEEAPAPGMSEALREKMCAAAVRLAQAVGYEGAGTVEFLVEGGSLGADAKWYFIEVNTRLQVEHPVTEEITGLDLVEWQLRVASGEPLPLPQDKIRMSGHAIEVRLCAEDPAKGFLPSVGRIAHFEQVMGGSGERLETGVEVNAQVSPYYDSMIAKIIMQRKTRGEAIDALIQSTERMLVGGVTTNARFLINLLDSDAVRKAQMDTGLIARDLDALTRPVVSRAAVIKALESHIHAKVSGSAATGGRREIADPWTLNDAFILGPAQARTYMAEVDGKLLSFAVAWVDREGASGRRFNASVTCHAWPELAEDVQLGDVFVRETGAATRAIERGRQIIVCAPTFDDDTLDHGADGSTVRAPINGKVAKVFVAEGEAVERGARIAVVEAMKMEHVLHAARAGTIARVAAREGQQVTQGMLIASLSE
jgi:3-methylcrotonyl-CoA carboxylase alpha subunit